MLMNSKIQDDSQEYKRLPNRSIKLEHLAYEEAKNIIETLDEGVITQSEYEYHQLSEDLALDSEDISWSKLTGNLC